MIITMDTRVEQSLGSGYGNCWNTLANIGFMKIASAYNGTPATAVRNIFNLEKVCGSESEAKPWRWRS